MKKSQAWCHLVTSCCIKYSNRRDHLYFLHSPHLLNPTWAAKQPWFEVCSQPNCVQWISNPELDTQPEEQWADGEAQREDLSVPHTDPGHSSPGQSAENTSCAAWEQESTNSHQVKDKQFSFSTAPVQQAKSSTQQDKRHWCGSSAQCWRQEWGKLRLILGKKPVFPKLSGDARSWCSQLLDVTDIFQICWRKNRWKSFALLLPLE